jgi:N utilization substance protein B
LKPSTATLPNTWTGPYRVILNEAITLTRKFGAEQGHAFVNGVLDRLAHRLRPDEYSRKPQQVNGL